MGRQKERICIICGSKRPSELFLGTSLVQKCSEHLHLYKCYKCNHIGEVDDFRPKTNPGLCKKCVNRKKTNRVKIYKTKAFIEKTKRASVNSVAKNKLRRKENGNIKIILSKDEVKSIKTLRCSIHNLFMKWNLEKSKASMKYLDYGHKEFLDKFPKIEKGESIDHLIPISWFKIDTPIGIVYHINNLQLMDLRDNIIKGNRYCSPLIKSYYDIALPYIKEELKEKLVVS